MKITAVETFVLRAPLDRPFAYSQGWYRERTAGIIRLRTDEGFEGIGECFGPPEPAAAVIESLFAPLLLGRDPMDNEVIWETLYNRVRDHGQKGIPIEALSGVDIAIWDLKGKVAGLPVFKLMGGSFRTKVQPYATGFYREENVPDPVRVLCKEAEGHVSRGLRAMKVKFGFGVDDDCKVARAIRGAVGEEIHLMADANHAYDAAAAIELGRELEKARYRWFEEPVVPEDLEGYRRVREVLEIPIAAGEAEFTRFGMKALICNRLVDIVQPDCCGTGGLTEAKRISLLANTWGIRCIPHVWGTRIATAAALHLIASLAPTPPSLLPIEPLLEFDCSAHPLRDNVVRETIAVDSDGMVQVPQAPGLGISLNEDFVERMGKRTAVTQ